MSVRPGLMADTEAIILNLIRSKTDMGICTVEIKEETIFSTTIINRSLNNLLTRNLIKQVVSIQNRRNKLYMGVEFEPCKEITGGAWYNSDGNLHQDLIGKLKCFCYQCMPATVDGVHNELMERTQSRGLTIDVSRKQIGEVLELMVLEGEIEEVKSTGVGDYREIAVGTNCYRRKKDKDQRIGAFSSIPCGACPRIGLCTADGYISPATCEYYNKWLNIKF